MQIIIVTWQPDKKSFLISGSQQYPDELLLNMLTSGLSCLVQTCTEANSSIKDWQILERIIANLNATSKMDLNQELSVILKVDFAQKLINISFPNEQGFLSIAQTADIISFAAIDIIRDSLYPERTKTELVELLTARFASTELPPVIWEQEFINKK